MKRVSLALLVLVVLQIACSFGNSGKVNTLIQQGDQLVEEKKYTEGIELYNQALELDPESSYAYSGRGRAHRLLKNYQQATSDLNKAIELDDTNYKAFRERGMVYYEIDNLASAVEDCQKSTSINPNFSLGHLCLGYIYEKQENFDAAYSEYTKTINLDANEGWAYANRGYIAYQYKNDKSKAIADFSKAIEILPDEDWVYFYRGNAYGLTGQYNEAIKDFSKTIELSSDNYYLSNSYNGIGYMYFLQENWEEAIKYYSLAIKASTSPNDSMMFYGNRAAAYDQLGDTDNTIADLTKYLELDQSDSEYARNACDRINYLSMTKSTNLFSLFFSALTLPCTRFDSDYETYGNNAYEQPNEPCGSGYTEYECAWIDQIQRGGTAP